MTSDFRPPSLPSNEKTCDSNQNESKPFHPPLHPSCKAKGNGNSELTQISEFFSRPPLALFRSLIQVAFISQTAQLLSAAAAPGTDSHKTCANRALQNPCSFLIHALLQALSFSFLNFASPQCLCSNISKLSSPWNPNEKMFHNSGGEKNNNPDFKYTVEDAKRIQS